MRLAPARRRSQPLDPVAGPPSFDTVYAEYFKFIWRSLRRLGVPLSALDDAVQEVFITVHRRLPEFERRSSLKTWLFGIALNVSQHAVRSAARQRVQRLPCAVAIDQNTPQEQLLRAEALELLYRALAELSPERRAALVMAELEQMSAPEIEEVTGWPLNTVYSRLRLARRDFEAVLKRLRAREDWSFR
jgi:RNA polymerase sigma-70 factor (ECF subfamily)